MRKNTTKPGFTIVEIVIALAAVGAIVGLGYYIFNQVTDDTSASLSVTETVDDTSESFDEIMELEQISEIARVEQSGSEIIGIELEQNDGQLVYVVHYSDGTTAVFDAISGTRSGLLDNDNDELDDDNDPIPANFVAGVTLREAIGIAKERRPDSTLRKVEVEVEDGVVVYSVRFTDDSRVDVNALDGTVQRLRNESGDNEIERNDDDESGDQDENDDSDERDEDDDDDSRDDDDSDERDEDDDDDEEDDDDEDDDDERDDNSGSSN